jgi:hypothetical protein
MLFLLATTNNKGQDVKLLDNLLLHNELWNKIDEDLGEISDFRIFHRPTRK